MGVSSAWRTAECVRLVCCLSGAAGGSVTLLKSSSLRRLSGLRAWPS